MTENMQAAKKKNNTFAEIKQIIDEHNNLLIISHVLPDGDNIGSVLALTRSLQQVGKTVRGIVNGTLPDYYRFLPGASELIGPDEADYDQCDLLLIVDAADRGRVGGRALEYLGKITSINIDHHISNDYFGDYNYVDPLAGATAEIITNFLEAAGYPLDETIAAPLYVGLLTDTGSFTFQNTRSATLAAGAKLLSYPIDLPAMRENVYGNISLKRKLLLGEILVGSKTDCNGELIWSTIGHARCADLGVAGADFEGIIDHLIAVAGIKIAVLIREIEAGDIKVGLRTKTGYNAVDICRVFGGGGHPGAAGCSVSGELAKAEEEVLQVVRHYLEEKR